MSQPTVELREALEQEYFNSVNSKPKNVGGLHSLSWQTYFIDQLLALFSTYLDKELKSAYRNGYSAGWEAGVNKKYPKGMGSARKQEIAEKQQAWLKKYKSEHKTINSKIDGGK